MLQKSLGASPTEGKAAAISDTVIYDLEDSVAPADKQKARVQLVAFLKANSPTANIAVRVNSTGTSHFERDIIETLEIPSIKTLVLPKVHSVKDLDEVSALILESTSKLEGRRDITLIASIESARAMWAVGEIASWKSRSSSTGSGGTLAALLFAAEDYCADTSIIRTPSRQELLFPRSRMVTAAKAFGLDAIDMVCVNYQDANYLREECEDGRRLGFTGKQAIHPNQVAVIQSTFVPSAKEVLRAARIVHHMEAAYAASASNEGRGAFGMKTEGVMEMMDAPMLKQAKNVLAAARAAGLDIPTIEE